MPGAHFPANPIGPMTDKASDAPHLLASLGKVLDGSGAKWAVIGAMAVAYHGWVRASLDADAMLSLRGSALDIERLADRIRSMGLQPEIRMGEPGDPLGFVLRVQDGDGNQADLIGGIRKLDPGFWDRVIRQEWRGALFSFASAEDLIALKLFAGGPKDLEDAEGVIRVQAGRLDSALLRKLCKGFGARAAKACERLLAKAGQA
jgi:hypothetical protein